MSRKFGTVVLLVGPLLAGCQGLVEINDDGGDVPARVELAFEESCAIGGCHDGTQMTDFRPAALATTLEGSVSGVPLVERGDIANSYVAIKLLDLEGIMGEQMPLVQTPNADENVAVIVGWIAGADIEGGGTDGETDGGPSVPCYGTAPEMLPDEPSFEVDVHPIFDNLCATAGCHASGAGMLTLPDGDATGVYAAMVDVAPATADGMLVASGDPQTSYLWHKLLGTQGTVTNGGGPTMPLSGELCGDDYMVIYRWILTGAMP